MNRLEQKHPSIEFFFCCGSDLIESLRTWAPINSATGNSELWDQKNILGLPRPGYPLSDVKELPPSFSWLGVTEGEGISLVVAELSSSEIRNRIHGFGDSERERLKERDLQSVEGLVPSACLSHILRNKLYMPGGASSGAQ